MNFELNPDDFSGQQSSSRSSMESISTAGYDPQLLSNFMKSAVSFTGDVDKAMAEIAVAAADRKKAEEAQQTAIVDYATKAGEATTASVAVDAAAAARRKQILDHANMNPDVISSMINQAFASINETASQLEPLGSEIDARAAVGIFDNPLEYLVNQTRLPGMVGEYNAIAERQNRAVQAARDLQTLAGTQQQISASMDADKIAAMGVAKAAAEASAAQAKLAEVQQQAAGATQRDIATKLAMTGQKLDTSAQMVRLSKEFKQMSVADRERLENAEAMDLELERINNWLAMAGSNTQYNKVLWKSTPAQVRNRLLEYAGTGKIGPTLFEAVTALQDVRGDLSKIANEGDAAATNWLRRSFALAESKKADIVRLTEAKGGKVNMKELPQQAFDVVQQQYDSEVMDMSKASDSNPRKIDYTFATTNYKLDGENRVVDWLKEFGPAGKTPISETVSEAVILDKLANDIAAGNITVGDAASQVAEFYKMGVQVQAERTKYPIFGLEYVNKYVVKTPRMPKGVDLTNQAAVETVLAKETARKILLKNPATMFSPAVPEIPPQMR
jgi:hypothetical protein